MRTMASEGNGWPVAGSIVAEGSILTVAGSRDSFLSKNREEEELQASSSALSCEGTSYRPLVGTWRTLGSAWSSLSLQPSAPPCPSLRTWFAPTNGGAFLAFGRSEVAECPESQLQPLSHKLELRKKHLKG